ncbi:MAG: hypothetical protein Q7W55_09440 [Pseudohongiella sp.]|nr:hypothetical protein [Pseudohongiella sp.]MDO9522080.1 hypothetical protein [Pseudohongiella sp.]MDP2129138.1 hypothetical protein [Pseudohongiella sp.]
MKRYLLSTAFAATLLGSCTLSLASETVNLNYEYSGKTGVSLSAISGGPLTVNAFTDGRSGSDANDIQRPGKEPLTLSNQTAASLLQSAFTQAFEASGAQLGDTDSPIALDGKLVEVQVQETAQGLETLIRVELTLRNQGRNTWQSVVFSKADSDSPDIAAAIEQGLNRLVTELFRDDYFLMALGIF